MPLIRTNFPWTRAPRGNDPDDFFLAFLVRGVADEEDSADDFADGAEADFSMFSSFLVLIDEWIIEDLSGRLEADAVFALVGQRLSWVPFEPDLVDHSSPRAT